MKRLLAFSLGLALAALGPQAQAERIKDIANINGVRSNQLVGYGIVVGLDGTGDNSPLTNQGLANLMGGLGMTTTQRFQQALKDRTKEGKPISSLRELYDQWVEMSEAAYAEFVMTEEYQELYGRLVNTLLALKQQMARMVDQTLEALHMPTHAEISTLQCRQQEIRRENLRLRKDMKELQAQMEALRQAMLKPAAEKPAPAAAPAKAPAAPKAAPKAAAKPAAPKAPAAKAAPAKKPAAK